MNTDKIKCDFPLLKRNPNLTFLDSAATSQKPLSVIQAMNDYYGNYNANVHRGIYRLSEEATEKYEAVRMKVCDFIGSKTVNDIIYTHGTTESINLVMRGYGEKFIKAGDKIVITILEHHSNFVPWQQLAKKKKAKLEIIDVSENGELKEDEINAKIKGAKIVALSHASNVLGTINPVQEICKIAREQGAISVVDGAQSVSHVKVDVEKIGCDFFVFSAHKMLGPNGIGILYGKEELLEKMDPFIYGGDMISKVTVERSEWNLLPYKFEAGTPPIAEAIGLGAAIDYLNRISINTIRMHEKALSKYAMKQLLTIKNLAIYGPQRTDRRTGVITFNLDGIHSHDVASILSEYNIAIRSGHHCAMPLHKRLKLVASARASLYLYNNKHDVDKLVDALKEVNKIFKVG